MSDESKKVIRVGSRGSRLAIAQAEIVMRQIEAEYPEVRTELVTVKTTGDRILDRTLDQIGGKGLFVKELDEALREGVVDITVHSLKDLPKTIPEDIPLIAVTKREDPRDVLVLPDEKTEIDTSLPAGTSSFRRSIQVKELIPGIETAAIRGNVDTRLGKLDEGQYSCLIMAAAGLKRLGLEHRISRYFSTDEMLPAACQGMIAVQARAGDNNAYLSRIGNSGMMLCAMAERAFIKELGADCGSPDAVYAFIQDSRMHITGMHLDPVSGRMIRRSLEGFPSDAKMLGRRLASLVM